MSRRAKKRVDYTQFGVGDDDDDFAEFTPPASKKAKTSSSATSKKESKREEKLVLKNEKKQDTRKERKSINRNSVTDEMFENELQMALELSMSQSQSCKEDEECSIVESSLDRVSGTSEDKENITVIADVQSLADGSSTCTDSSASRLKADTKPDIKTDVKVNKSEDEIEVLSPVVDETLKPRRRSASKKVVIDDDENESDLEPEYGPESSDDDDDDDDEDYSGEDSDFKSFGKKSKAKKKAPPKKQTTPKNNTAKTKSSVSKQKVSTKTTIKTPSVSKVGTKPALVKSSPAVTRPPLSTPSPRWNPPGRAGNKDTTVSLQSPSSGLRLGLSRNMKLKPLHPNIKVQQ